MMPVSPLAALALLAAAHWPGAAQADRQIRAQRAAFNRAIAHGDLDAIGAFLADKAQIVTGTDSLIFNGKADELRLWSEDLHAPSRGIYVRTPDRIDPVAGRADGDGERPLSRRRHQVGQGLVVRHLLRQVAPHRRDWKIESETYMTTACGGSYCPNARTASSSPP